MPNSDNSKESTSTLNVLGAVFSYLVNLLRSECLIRFRFVAGGKLNLSDSQNMELIEAIRETQKGLSVLRDFIR